ncbi:hypothetical protein ACLOJK_036912 [Asimina triloba]
MDRDGFDALAIDARCPRHRLAGEDGFRPPDPPRARLARICVATIQICVAAVHGSSRFWGR